jgi:sugar-specific transcriptional regulator TrmB
MDWQAVDLLDELGFSSFDKKALITLSVLGVSEASALCREGKIPTSKIYQSMEKLSRLGLVQLQRSRPKLYSALPPDEVVDRLCVLARRRAEDFTAQAAQLRRELSALPERIRGRRTSVDLALGVESHVKRHLVQLATARKRILSYMEQNDLAAVSTVAAKGFDCMRRIARHAEENGVRQQVVFGFSHLNADSLLGFLKEQAASLTHLRGVRFSGELGHPFHVIDDDRVILSLDHPFVEEKRFASLLVRDREIAKSLIGGFRALWKKAMRDLREIRFHPGSR